MAEKEYIEREAALKRNYFSESKTPDDNYRFNAEIKFCISSLPAADVAPVNHGHWYNRGGRFRCSVCDNKALLKDIGGTGGWSHEYEQQKSPYCPNCGAKMDP